MTKFCTQLTILNRISKATLPSLLLPLPPSLSPSSLPLPAANVITFSVLCVNKPYNWPGALSRPPAFVLSCAQHNSRIHLVPHSGNPAPPLALADKQQLRQRLQQQLVALTHAHPVTWLMRSDCDLHAINVRAAQLVLLLLLLLVQWIAMIQ